MTENLKQSLRDSKGARWFALSVVAFTMLCGYYITDAMNPLKPLLETQLGWTSGEFGVFAGAYGWFNVFLLMLIFGGIILDKMGVRFTGIGAAILMIIGTAVNYYSVSPFFPSTDLSFFGLRLQVLVACLGFATFGVGAEVAGITVSRVIVKWFKGKEMALAMGLEMATARMGTLLAMAIPLPLANYLGGVSKPILVGLILLCVGLVSFMVYCIQDKKLEQEGVEEEASEEEFKISDIKEIVTNGGFWLLALLCVLFYSAIFPWIKFSADLMINKYQVDPALAGLIPALLPMGCLVLTPLFGSIYDHKGKGATIMIIGALLLIAVHIVFLLPIAEWIIAMIATITLGITLSLLPSAMWPSVPKIIPERLLGTAYALTFWVQNWGLLAVPTVLGLVLNYTNAEVLPTKTFVKETIEQSYHNYAEQLGLDHLSKDKFNEEVGITTNEVVNYILCESDYEASENLKVSDLDDDELSDMYYVLIESLRREGLDKEALKAEFDKQIKTLTMSYAQSYKLPLRYNYLWPNVIFVIFGLLSLLIAFMLKLRDKKYNYGLELPNIEK